jgi:hypothetical protein
MRLRLQLLRSTQKPKFSLRSTVEHLLTTIFFCDSLLLVENYNCFISCHSNNLSMINTEKNTTTIYVAGFNVTVFSDYVLFFCISKKFIYLFQIDRFMQYDSSSLSFEGFWRKFFVKEITLWSQALLSRISDVNVSFFLWSKTIRFLLSFTKKRMLRSFFPIQCSFVERCCIVLL